VTAISIEEKTRGFSLVSAKKKKKKKKTFPRFVYPAS